ncbi:Uncharacterised protein [Vibrio cholerae]|nr:Uncharacterised protein [Vibrio cholerae]
MLLHVLQLFITALSEKIILLGINMPLLESKLLRPITNQKHMITMTQHIARELNRVANMAHTSNRASLSGCAMHHRGIHLHHFIVRQY